MHYVQWGIQRGMGRCILLHRPVGGGGCTDPFPSGFPTEHNACKNQSLTERLHTFDLWTDFVKTAQCCIKQLIIQTQTTHSDNIM